MPANAQTESTIVPVNFNNLMLKQWLHSVGPVRRCEVLKKFKEYLQALGLSKRQVHRGIVQLATKPHVVLTHVLPGRRYGIKNSLEEDEERKGEDCTKDRSFLEHSRLSNEEDVHTPSTTENSSTEDSKLVQRSKRLKTSPSIENIDEITASSTDSKEMNHSTELFHSFDKALEQLDELMYTKMSGHEKSHSKRSPGPVSSYSTRKSCSVDSTNAKDIRSNKRSRKSSANDENKDIRLNRKTSELTHGKTSTSVGHTRDLAKKTRLKLDLRSYYRKREAEGIKCEYHKKTDADYVKSDAVKKPDTDYAKTDVDEKSHKSKKCTDSRVERISSQDKRLKHESKRNVLASCEVTKIDEAACKRKLYETVTSITTPRRKKICAAVENKNFDKYKMKQLSKKLRVYFGDCITMSEDEQEQRILERRFKRTRKKPSVDSCDSGVCVIESEKTVRVIEVWKNTQKSILDSITVGEFNEDVPKNTIADNVAGDKSEEITEKIKTVYCKVVNDKIQNGTSTINSVRREKYISRETLMNILNNSAVPQNRIVLNIEASQITEQLEINVTVGKANLETGTEAYSKLEPKAGTEKEQTELRPEAGVETRQSELQQAEPQPRLESIVELELEPELESEVNAKKGTEVDARTDIDATCEIPNNVNEDRSKSQESNLDTGDLDELLQMNFSETFQITSKGNVLSIQESVEENISRNIMKESEKDVDENGNLKVLPDVHASNKKTITEEVSDCIEENNNLLTKDIELSSGVEQSTVVSISDVHRPCNVNVSVSDADTTCSVNDSVSDIHTPCNANQPTQEPELNSVTEKKNNEPNNGCQGKLRVLSSAELGSRWCPTPVHVSTSTVPQTNAETVSKVPLEHTAPIIVSSVTLVSEGVPLAVPVSTPAPAINVDEKAVDPVNVTVLKIFNLIQSFRIPSLTTKFNYDKLLLSEFKKLRIDMKTENYISLINGTIHLLNSKWLVNPPVSVQELFHFSPSLKLICARISEKLGEYYKLRALAMFKQVPTSQNAYCSQPSQNMNAKSVQPNLQNAHYVSNTNNQSSMNVPPKRHQQNCTKTAALHSQNKVLQNNTAISSMAGNNACAYQQNYKVQQQQIFSQRNLSNAYVVKQKPITNVYGTQSVLVQHSVASSDGINPLGGQQIPQSNASFMNQLYAPQRVFTQPVNAYYNISPPNYPIQQNNTPSHMKMQNVDTSSGDKQYQVLGTMPNPPAYNISRDTQVKQFPQQMPLNYVPQSVQGMFPTSMPYSNYKPNNVQQSEKMNQRMFPMAQSKVPQNQVPEQMPPSQHTHNTCSSKVKQPVLRPKKQEYVPVSLESTTKVFGVLKYLSNAERDVLQKHLDFYFTCTTWLQQAFLSKQWHSIHRQRSTLLYLQTLLKHFTEKSVKEVPNKSQGYTVETNILPSTVSDIPKAIHIIVRENDENEKVSYQVNVCTTEQYLTKNVDQSCTTSEEDCSVITVSSQSEEEYMEMEDSRSKEFSNQSQTLDKERMPKNKPTEEITLLQKDNPRKDAVEKELEQSVSAHRVVGTKQSLDELGKIVNTLPQANEDRVSVISSLQMCNQDAIRQPSPHLVTVEISSNSDQVTVIDTNTMSENMSERMNITECIDLKEEKFDVANTLPSLENTICNKSAIPFPAISNGSEQFREPNTDCSSLGGPTITQIADVRSISLETFEKMEESNNASPNSVEDKIEEEEIKICLFCGKPSTVACSICFEAKYCSKDCFELHWEDHYKDCKPVESIHL